MEEGEESVRNRQRRNYAIGAILLVLVALLFAVTIAKLGQVGLPG